MKGGVAISGDRALRRRLLGPRLRARRATRARSSGRRARSRASAAPATSTRRRRSPTAASTSARPTARSTRSARRAASCAGRSRPAATSTRRRRSGATASSSARTRTRFFCFDAATGDVLLAVQGERADLRLADGRRAAASTSRRSSGTTYALDARTGALALDVPGRQVLAGRRRLATRLYLVGYARALRARSELRGPVGSWTAAHSGRRLPRDASTSSPGAAGLHRLAPASRRRSRLARPGHEVVGLDCFTDYYDPALKEENARGLDVRRVDLAEDALDFAGFDGVFHLAGQPGVRSFGDVFPLYLRRNVLASQRVFEAAARAGVRSSSRRSSSVYGDAERYPTPEDDAAAADLAVRDHEARLRAPRTTRTRAVRPRRGRRCATSTRSARASGPTWRSRASSLALAAGDAVRALRRRRRSRAAGPTSATSSTATIAAMERGAGHRTTSAAAIEASMNEAIALLERLAGAHARRPAHEPPVPGDQRRTKADTTRIRARARLGAATSARGRSREPVGMGVG